MLRSVVNIHKAILLMQRFPASFLGASATLSCRNFSKEVSLQYFVLNDEHGEDVARFLASYAYPLGPLNIACGSNTYTERPYIKTLLVPSGVSVAVKDSNTGVMVGVLVNYIHVRNQNIDVFDYSSVTHPGMKLFCQMMKYLDDDDYIFKDPVVNKVLKLTTVAIHPAQKQQGLGTKLVEMSEELGKAQGCQVSTVSALNPYSKKLLLRLGYKTVSRVDCHELKFNGESVFHRDLLPPDATIDVFFKEL